MAKKIEKQDTEAATVAIDEAEARIIKRYSNRKLYDTKDSSYVTLQQIGEMVRRGEHVRIIDNKTKEDKTEVTLALIISEDLKNKPQSVPLGTLRSLIQERGEKLLSQLRDGPIGRLIPGAGEEEGAGGAEPSQPGEQPAAAAGAAGVKATPSTADAQAGSEEKHVNPAMARLHELVENSRQTLDQLESTLEERVRELVPGVGLVAELRTAVDSLTQRVEALEKRIAALDGKGHRGSGSDASK